jgi:hypothetical protein
VQHRHPHIPTLGSGLKLTIANDNQLVNTLATLGEYPLIRYYNPPSSFHPPLGPALAVGEHLGKRLAERVQAEMDAYARDNTDFPVSSDCGYTNCEV